MTSCFRADLRLRYRYGTCGINVISNSDDDWLASKHRQLVMFPYSIPTVSGSTRASLLGLPAELRLEIYSYLVETARFHVDGQYQSNNARRWEFTNLRPCHTPDPEHPSLCARPCYSGLSRPEDLCHNITKLDIRRSAIRKVCRLFYKESKGILDECWIGLTVAQRTYEAPSVLGSMTVQQLELLVDLTIQVMPAADGSDYCGLWPAIVHLRRNHAALPNLRTLAVQAPQRLRNLSQNRTEPNLNFDPEIEWRWQWFVIELSEIFQSRVQIIFEGWIVLRAGHPITKSTHDQMLRIRGTVGICNGSVYGEEGCKCTFEMVSQNITGGQGQWTEFWRGRNMGYDREPLLPRAGGQDYVKSQVVKNRDSANWWRQYKAERSAALQIRRQR
jgi:hypothetical protein